MDGWPADGRQQTSSADTIKSKSKEKAKDSYGSVWRYPVVELGSLSAASLRHKKERLEWSFLGGGQTERKIIPIGDPVRVFPETRTRPLNTAEHSILQRAEQGAQFLHDYYPDVDVPAEIIRAEISQDAQASHSLEPVAGSMIQAFPCPNGRPDPPALLAFPMGESRLDLNISPLTFSKKERVKLRPTAQSAWTFQTPIQQIAAVHEGRQQRQFDAILAVRTLSATSFLQLKSATQRIPTIQAKEVLSVTRSNTGNRKIADVVVSASQDTLGFVVNDVGAIYKFAAAHIDNPMQLVYSQTSSESTIDSNLWRIAPWADDTNCLLLSPQTARLIDFRTQGAALDVLSHQNSRGQMTAIEGQPEDNLVRLITEKEIVWADVRNTRQPVLGLRHGREVDRTLTMHSELVVKSPLTFLTSRKNGLVTVYDVSRTSPRVLHVDNPAYALPALQSPGGHNLGQVFLQHPSNPDKKDLSIFQLSEFGAVYAMDLRYANDEEIPDVSHRLLDWPPQVQELERQVKSSPVDVGPLGGRKFSLVDMQAVYRRLFMDDQSADDSGAVYELLEKMPSFWQQLESPIDHILTSFDVAYRCGPEPVAASRNDTFTESLFSSKRGYRAAAQGRLPILQLAKRAPWHSDVTDFVRHTIPDLQGNSTETLELLERYDLLPDDTRPGPSFRRETEAREQLFVDLSLSTNIFSPHCIEKAQDSTLDDVFETMSRATEAMTLVEKDPPRVRFGFLRPTSEGSVNHYSSLGTDTPVPDLAPLGVRLLLSEWEIGSDPLLYTYVDPYGLIEAPVAPPVRQFRKPINTGMQATEQLTQTQTQRPPPIVPAVARAPPAIVPIRAPPMGSQPPVTARSQEAPIVNRPVFDGGSQPVANGWGEEPLSQMAMPSTQVLPGPHGGRPALPKKKPIKKRIGGF